MTIHVSCMALKLGCFGGGSCGEKFFSVGDEAFFLGGGHGQGVFCAFGKLLIGEGGGGAEEIFQFGFAENVPMFEGDPVGAGEVGSGDDAFDFEKLVEAFRIGGEGERGFGEAGATGVVEVDEGEHLASDGLVGDPEDEVVAPLTCLDGVGKGEEIGANAFGVHCWSFPGYPLPPGGGYFGRNSFVIMRIALGCAAKILHSNELLAKYYK
jgi:hypothetical protein